jgi:hypothetical protein
MTQGCIGREGEGWSMTRRLIAWGVLMGIVFMIAQNGPDIIRYLKIRNM